MSSSGDSVFSENSIDYWQEVEKISEQYRKLSQLEEQYIFERDFHLNNQNYKLVTGFSAARNYIPAVRILGNAYHISKTDHISFDADEWNEFIVYLQYFLKEYFTSDNNDVSTNVQDQQLSFEINYIKISAITCLDFKALKVDNGEHIYYLSEIAVREIIDVHERLMDAHLFTLYKLNLYEYYDNFLESANDILCKSNYDLNPEDVLLNLCSNNVMLDPQLSSFSFIQLYCIRECLFYNKNKVLNDLDRKL